MPDMESLNLFDDKGRSSAHEEPRLLASFPPDSFERLLMGGEELRLEPGATLVVEGRQDTDMYILLTGELDVMAPLNEGWVQVAVLGQGSVIGEMAFLDNLPRSTRVIAHTKSSALKITRESFQDLAGREPRVALEFVLGLSRIISYRLRRVERFDAAETVREQERKSLAGELHDQTLGALGSMAIGLGLLIRQASRGSDNLAPGLEEVRDRLNDTDRGLREIVQGIYPQALTILGLVPAVKSLLKELSNRPISSPRPLEVDLRATGFDKDRLPEEIEISVYRVIQQGLDNVIQHAQADKVNIDLTWSDLELTLSLSDDGVGFDVDNPGQSPRTGHFGLVNLRDRIERHLGTIELDSVLGEGTTLRARIPVITGGSRPAAVENSTYVL